MNIITGTSSLIILFLFESLIEGSAELESLCASQTKASPLELIPASKCSEKLMSFRSLKSVRCFGVKFLKPIPDSPGLG